MGYVNADFIDDRSAFMYGVEEVVSSAALHRQLGSILSRETCDGRPHECWRYVRHGTSGSPNRSVAASEVVWTRHSLESAIVSPVCGARTPPSPYRNLAGVNSARSRETQEPF